MAIEVVLGLFTCRSCNRAWAGRTGLCPACLDSLGPPVLLPGLVAVGIYRASLKRLVRAYKFSGARTLAEPLAMLMASAVRQANWRPDLVTFVPLHPTRLRARGYDQAELLARRLARELDLPAGRLLERRGRARRQSRLTPWARAGNLSQAFEHARHSPSRVLLVDDVYTTGATVESCRLALQDAGAIEVLVAVAALAASRPATAAGYLLDQFPATEASPGGFHGPVNGQRSVTKTWVRRARGTCGVSRISRR